MLTKLNSTALAKAGSTSALRISHLGKIGVCYVGDLDGETLTMEASIDDGATWSTCYPSEDGTVAETYSNTTPSARPRVFMLPGGIRVRWTMSDGAGTPSGVYVGVDGEGGEIIW